MKKAQQPDNFVFYVVGVALVLVVLGFAAAGFYFQKNAYTPPPVSYAQMGPVVVRTSQFSIKASFAVETGNGDVQWVRENWTELRVVLQTALEGINPERARGPDGLLYVQGVLRDAANSAFHTQNIQQVLLTDFIIQNN